MSYTTLLIIIMAIYFVAMIGISVVGRKKAESFENYLDAGKSCGIIIIVGILAQIYHCGRQTNTGAIPGLKARSSSPIMCPFGDDIPDPFTVEEIKELVGKYGDTALRAKKCGFDGVEIHAAHGYLITQFFSPYSNKRIDEYGGNFWNRTRFAREIVADIREKCGDDFIIDMRLSGDEFVEGGLNIEDTKAIARMMEGCGVDILHISIGNYLAVDKNIASSHYGHGWFTDWAKAVKEVVSIPVITISRINDPFLADSIIASGRADFVAMGRESLCDPAMPRKAQETTSKGGHLLQHHWPVVCSIPGRNGEAVSGIPRRPTKKDGIATATPSK